MQKPNYQSLLLQKLTQDIRLTLLEETDKKYGQELRRKIEEKEAYIKINIFCVEDQDE